MTHDDLEMIIDDAIGALKAVRHEVSEGLKLSVRSQNLGYQALDKLFAFKQHVLEAAPPVTAPIEKVDGWFPTNCRWADNTAQARNRSNKRLEYMDAYTICCRMLSGYSAKSIAEEFGCSESLPREILKGRTWKDACKAAYEFMGVKECPVK